MQRSDEIILDLFFCNASRRCGVGTGIDKARPCPCAGEHPQITCSPGHSPVLTYGMQIDYGGALLENHGRVSKIQIPHPQVQDSLRH